MDANAFTKVVLSLILGLLVILVVRGFDGAASGDAGIGRYHFELHSLRRYGSVLLRHDTVTGEVWALQKFGQPEPEWIPIDATSPVEDAGATP